LAHRRTVHTVTLAGKPRSLVTLAGIRKFADTPAGNVSRWRRCEMR
jgi:hypothetical protein